MDTSNPMPNAAVLQISPYVGGKSKVAGVLQGQRIVKLSSNENPHGASPKVEDFLSQNALHLHRYPDGACTALREAIGSVYDIHADQIVCGAGSDELISLLCKAYCAKGDEVIYSQHGFLMYKLSALAVGAVPVVAAETNLTSDVDALLACVTDKTKIVFIANPNNPTGTWINKDEIQRLVKGLPAHVILALDSAYCEYVDQQGYTDGRDIVKAYNNVIMLRTFSKIYGIAGLRLGWMHASPEICDVMNRVRGPFNVSNIAQEAGRVAVLDQDYVTQCRKETIQVRAHFSDALQAMGFGVVASQGNFILIQFDDAPCSADQVDAALGQSGIIVRRMESYGLANALRITIGLESDVERIIQIFKSLTE